MIGCAASGEGEMMMQSLICRSWVDYIKMGTDYFHEQIPAYMCDAQYGIVSVDNVESNLRVGINVDQGIQKQL